VQLANKNTEAIEGIWRSFKETNKKKVKKILLPVN
jgi:hypothetical protein